ncbi:hypothetical protein SAPIO_CDS2193 [Scedosporium apiospermum]|uniref:Uncharacterized protein n=1 Tax=Pseudallescheria apiosperma TaxID=563466 RepID=A0A084GDF7_PSEDA|nr:uncharacterized protein SAPIO_CDS2193 [Scedosporium apiospermum]KEZ45369.1 hypothetical protein SAPIO_CDS2193 [Scedosporium apiospermum]
MVRSIRVRHIVAFATSPKQRICNYFASRDVLKPAFSMHTGSSKLCSTCMGFDVRKLLLTAEAQRPGNFNDPSAPDTYENIRPFRNNIFF